MAVALPPLPAIGSCIIEVFGPDTDAATWDNSTWDNAAWARVGWSDVTPQSMTMQLNWGADDPAGVLSTPAASTWTITTYDPDRKLDPSNGSSPLATSLKPGSPIRISHKRPNGELVTIRRGLIDTVKYDLLTRQGSLTGTDDIQIMVGAKLPAGQNLDTAVPGTLRARARYFIKKAKLQNLIAVEGDRDYSLIIAESMPLAWWRFDDLNTTGVIKSVSGLHNGTVQGGTVDAQQAPLVSGGKSFKFSNAGHIEVNSPVILNADWTLSVAVDADTLPLASTFILIGKENVNTPVLRLSTAGEVQLVKGAVVVASSPAITVGLPHLIHCVHNAAGTRIYVDGVDVTIPGTASTFSSSPGTVLKIGAYAGAATAIYMDEPVIHNRALGPVEIAAIYSYAAGSVGLYDPPVGAVIEGEATVWSHILTAALDALYAVWMDRLGVLRFRSFGNPQDTGVQIGGAEGIPIDTLGTEGSLQQVYTKVTAFDTTAPTVEVSAVDQLRADIYGELLLHRDSPVPNAQAWVDAVLADRSGSGLTYMPGTLRLQTEEHLLQLVSLGMIDIANVAVESVTPQVNVATRVLGATLTADTDAGWTCKLLTYIPAKEWEEATEPTPPEPPIIPPPNVTQVVRTYTCLKDARLAHSGSLDAGNGVDDQIFVGYVGGYRNRMVAGFQSIPWGGVVEVVKAELLLTTSTAVCGSFGSSPKVIVSRITGSWSEGSYSAACGFATSNSVKYPGPSTTSSGQVTRSITKSESTAVSIDITAIARSWFGGSSQHGVMLKSAGEDSSTYSTEFKSRHHSTTSHRPQLKLTLKVAA